MSVSVALAAKDGARYLADQGASILPQLSAERGDELIISTDPSSDDTAEIAAELAKQFALIKLLQGPGKGTQANFELAIKACKGTHIFLSDQDDVWLPGKVTEVLKDFETSGAALIIHDAIVVDEYLKVINPSYFAMRNSKPGVYKNFVKNSFVGCCMAFKAELIDIALPFPSQLPMHDQWLGLVASRYQTVSFLPLQLVQYRRHTRTATKNTHAGFFQMMLWRFNLLKALRQRHKMLP
jgi:glycosyltransferase involved in cell wall biosynthesis